MKIYQLSEDVAGQLLKEPETGMGYQSGTLRDQLNHERQGFFLSGQYFSQLEPGRSIQGTVDLSKGLLLEAPQAEKLFQFALGSAKATVFPNFRVATAATTPLPPHSGITQATDVFFRLSAYRTDKRINADGSIVPGTYTTSDTDITVVPNGLVAVGRYALPTRISARYVFEIRPGAGIAIQYGTVTPNYGLAGGGVEVFFPSGAPAGSGKFARTLPEK